MYWRNYVEWLTGNHILNVAILAFFSTQVFKVIVEVIMFKKVDFRRILGSGGMPSSHSATVSALAAAVAKVCGTGSPEFAISVILAIIVMFDASNVRRAAGEQAKILNRLMKHWSETTQEEFGRELKELLGHTPIQVFVGSAMGIAFGVIM